MKTDLTYDDIMTIVSEYKAAGQSIKSYTVQGEEAMIDGASYQVASAAVKQKNSDRIRNELGLEPSDAEFTGRVDYDDSYDSTSTTSTYDNTYSDSYGDSYGTSTYGY